MISMLLRTNMEEMLCKSINYSSNLGRVLAVGVEFQPYNNPCGLWSNMLGMSLKFSDLLYHSVDDSAGVMASDLSWNCHLGNEDSIYILQGAEANVGSKM